MRSDVWYACKLISISSPTSLVCGVHGLSSVARHWSHRNDSGLPRTPQWRDGIHEIQMFQQVSASNVAPNWGLFPHGLNWHISTGLRQDKSGRGEMESPTMGDTQQHAHREGSGFILCGKPSHGLAQQLWARWLSAKVAFSPPSGQPWGQRGCMIASVCYITLTWWRILSWGLK